MQYITVYAAYIYNVALLHFKYDVTFHFSIIIMPVENGVDAVV